MPKYTSLQIDLIEYLSQTLPKFAPAARHNNDSGYAYLQRVRNYMLGHFDGEGLDISQQFSAFAPSVKTGSGVSVKQPRFDTDDRRQLISAYDTCAENIQHMYQDRSLMQREPMLGAIMRYADLQFRLAGPEGPNTHGYYSDKVLQTITTALGQMQNIPSAAKMNELSVQDPQAYQAGVSIMNLMHAWCDYNEPEPAISSEQIDQADPQALRQDKIRKLTNLKNALQAVSDAGEDNFRKFMVATGNDDYLLQSCDLIFNPKNSANCQAAADQLGQQISLLQQGLTLQEIRLLSDFSAVVKDGKGELGGQGIKFANLFEPFRTQAMAVDELSRQCAEKLQNGFGSEQEKNDFFKRLGTEAAQFGDSLANINLD